MNRDVAQLLLQVDASVALAQRNLNLLASQVDGNATRMDTSLARVDKAFSRVGNSAESSAQVFIRGKQAADSLIGSIDPLYAAQVRYDQELARAQALQRQGMLTATEFAKVQTGLKQQLDDQVMVYGGVAKGAGNARLAQMELMHVVRGSVDQYAAGANVTQIFAMHMGMHSQSAALGGDSQGKFGKIMGGPYGIAVTLGLGILTALIAKHHETAQTVDDLIEHMRKQTMEAANQESANKIWAHSIDGVREAQEKLRKELEQSLQTEGTLRQQNLDQAKSRLDEQKQQLAKAEQQLKDARAQLASEEQAARTTPGAVGYNVAPTGSSPSVSVAQQRVDQLARNVQALKSNIEASERTVLDAQLTVANASADASSQATAAIQNQTDAFKGLVNAGVAAKKITVDAAEKARIAINEYDAAQQAAAAQGVNIAKVGVNSQINKLTKSFATGKADVVAYAKALEQAAKALRDAAKAAADAKKGTGELASFIMPVNGTITSGFGARKPPTAGASSYHPAIDIAAPTGTPVKAAAAGVVISVGRMGGLGNVVIVDHGGGTITEYGHLSKILTNKGATVGQGDVVAQVGSTGISTGPHLDYRVRVHGKYVDPRKGSFPVDSVAAGIRGQNAAEAAANRGIRDEGAFQRESDQLDAEILGAKRELAGDFHDQAQFAKDEIDAQKKKSLASVDQAEQLGQIGKADADLLRGKIEELAEQKKKLVKLHEQIQALDEDDKDRAQQSQVLQRNLEFLDSIAKTAGEHRRLQLEILDIVYQEKLKHLETLKAQEELAGHTREAARIQGQINDLPNQKYQDQQHVERGTQGPWESYIDNLPHTTDQINEGIDSIKVQGLEGAIDTLSQFTNGWDAMRQTALSAIKDVVAALIRMALMRAAFSIFGAATGGFNYGAANAAPGAFAVTGLDGGVASSLSAPSIGSLMGFDEGGLFRIGGKGGIDQNVLSINGRPQIRVSAGEKLAVIPRVPKVRAQMPANDTGAGGVVIHSHFHNHARMPESEARRTARQHASVLRDQLTPAIK